jgi:hypothetical protein
LIDPPGHARAGAASRSALRRCVNYAAMGVVASVLADVTHEVFGHLLAARLSGDRIISLSTVAVQSAAESRFVAGAGTTANIVVGAMALVIMNIAGRARRPGSSAQGRIFLWLFAAFSLLNCGYLVVSAVLGTGDWAVVIKGLAEATAWRFVLAAVGAALYVRSMHWLARSMAQLVEAKDVAVSELRPLVAAAYVAGGAVMTLASMFNPISPSLILLSGVGASFGLSAGMLLIPAAILKRFSAEPNVAAVPSTLSAAWICLAIVVAGIFIAVLGPGIRFGNS